MEGGVEFTTLSKSYNMAGWRIGFAVGNPDIIQALEVLQDHLNCSQWGAIQAAAQAALLGPDDSVNAMRMLYQSRREAFIQAAAGAGWIVPPSDGSIFLWCPVPTSDTALSWAQRILDSTGVVVAPGSAFGSYGEGYVRIALTESEDRLMRAANRIAAVLNEAGAARTNA
jgi:aminotransferase